MTLCTLLRCELPVEPGSDYCFRHQNVGRGEQHEPFDPELARLRSKLNRIEAVARECFVSNPYNTTAALRSILEVIDGP